MTGPCSAAPVSPSVPWTGQEKKKRERDTHNSRHECPFPFSSSFFPFLCSSFSASAVDVHITRCTHLLSLLQSKKANFPCRHAARKRFMPMKRKNTLSSRIENSFYLHHPPRCDNDGGRNSIAIIPLERPKAPMPATKEGRKEREREREGGKRATATIEAHSRHLFFAHHPHTHTDRDGTLRCRSLYRRQSLSPFSTGDSFTHG